MKSADDKAPPHRIGELARQFRLSRTTLLYYDRIGLLRPSSRSPAGYRQYSHADVLRLSQICRFRQAGLPIARIQGILDGPRPSLTQALVDRLEELNTEIEHLRSQQRFIIGILDNEAYTRHVGVMNKQRWRDLLAASGFTEEAMLRWHAAFERTAPEQHQRFLEFLCIPQRDIAQIRARAQKRR